MTDKMLDIYEPSPTATTLRTHIDILNPDPDTIRLDDMMLALSRQNRYNGHTSCPVSVLRHLVLCDAIAGHLDMEDPLQRLAVILHDGHEYVIGDMSRPMKRLIVNKLGHDLVGEIEHGLDQAIGAALIGRRYRLEDVMRFPSVKRVDNLALALEVSHFQPKAAADWTGLPSLPEDLNASVGYNLYLQTEDLFQMFECKVHYYAEEARRAWPTTSI